MVGSKLGAEGTQEFQQAKFQPKSRIVIYGGFSMIEANTAWILVSTVLVLFMTFRVNILSNYNKLHLAFINLTIE